jgi:hypothetical protein
MKWKNALEIGLKGLLVNRDAIIIHSLHGMANGNSVEVQNVK